MPGLDQGPRGRCRRPACLGTRLTTTTYDVDGLNLPGGPDGLWPDNDTFTTDADGRFQVDGLKRDATTTISVTGGGRRTSVRLNTGEALKNLTAAPGEVRDLGEVKVSVPAE